jgi:hypothetical protein
MFCYQIFLSIFPTTEVQMLLFIAVPEFLSDFFIHLYSETQRIEIATKV